MLIILDLDGTLINTVHPDWKPYKDGLDGYLIDNYLDQLPIFPGAIEFIQSRKAKGDCLLVVSDSHTKYVEPICNWLGLDFISLADKPNKQKFDAYINTKPFLQNEINNENCFVIGDTKLDIEFGRKIKANTIWFLPYIVTDAIIDERDGIGDKMMSLKMGPTYSATSFQEIETILDAPLSSLYSLEASFVNIISNRAVKFSSTNYLDGSFARIRCLARQEQGVSDRYACADKYFSISNINRTEEFLQTIAGSVSTYIGQNAINKIRWDFFTYLTDKQTTIPQNKMKEIFDMISTDIPKVQLLKWSIDVQGSLRRMNLYADRQNYLQSYLCVECPDSIVECGEADDKELPLKGKNIIVLDDQLTTSATAWHVIRCLKEKGAYNILFIALFQMIMPVSDDVICPRCGKPMLLKIRRSDGRRFYSCVPPKYNGDGCGYTIDTESNNI